MAGGSGSANALHGTEVEFSGKNEAVVLLVLVASEPSLDPVVASLEGVG